MHWLERWIFPPRCVVTDRLTDRLDISPALVEKWRPKVDLCPRCAEPSAQGWVCGRCLRSPPAFSRTQVAFEFEHELRELIHQLKYHRQLHLTRLFAELMAESFDRHGVEALVPIPLHRTRLRERGFNQALEIARMLGKQLDLPVVDALSRPKASPSQTNLNAQQRRRNLKSAFVFQPQSLNGIGKLALVDDVITTGSTMQAAASTLANAQAGLVIEAWALAKTL
ncbi:ComF family protein [Thiomicrospira microaerophila]|uniref:ComF family protein n=1 Tax=Thiomicrospira microaerophila TaxID=406020 RepID=UPI0020102017|nr:ComF family protein [Thiomicrospira microaerophila]UQB42400.1 ComF family protein [Thiomicrospira microaerophila]